MKKYVLTIQSFDKKAKRIVPAKSEREAISRLNDNEELISCVCYSGKSETQLYEEHHNHDVLMRLSCYAEHNVYN